MDVRPVDPRDIRWEDRASVFRVSFRSGSRSDEYELTGAADVAEVLRWAHERADGRAYTVCAVIDPHPAERGLLQLATVAPRDRPCA
jgi:hypothetical protein